MQLLLPYINDIRTLCQTHSVSYLAVFGSVAKDAATPNSDVDLVVRFAQVPLLDYFNNYMSFKEQLEELLGRRVDIIEDEAVRNPIFRKVLDREMRTVYERKAA